MLFKHNLLARLNNFKNHLIDNTNYSILKFERLFGLKKYVGGFVLYNKYSRKDVFRILNWDKNPLAQNVGGYMFNPERTNCAIFVTYHKSDEISDTTKYLDKSSKILKYFA